MDGEQHAGKDGGCRGTDERDETCNQSESIHEGQDAGAGCERGASGCSGALPAGAAGADGRWCSSSVGYRDW